MLNRKLLEVLRRLSAAELRRLRLFLCSPFFNTHRQAADLIRLYDYIVEREAEETHPELEKSTVAQVFFPQTPFREKEKGPLDALASDLFVLVRRFLAQQLAERETAPDYREAMALLRFYRKHGLEDRFRQAMQAAQKAQEARKIRDDRFFFEQFHLEEEEFHFRSWSNSFADDANLTTALQNLDAGYAVLKLEYACALRYQQKMAETRGGPDALLLAPVLAWTERYPDVSPLSVIYVLVYELIDDPQNSDAFSRLEQLLDEHRNAISADKYRDLMAYYRYFWARRYFHSGDDFTRQRMFDVYRTHYEQGYFDIDDGIASNPLKVLVNFGLKLGQFDWVKKLLDDCPPERIRGTRYPAEFHSLNLAEYHFYKKEYAEALDKLNYRPFENPNLSILAEVLLIKVYFETGDELLDFRIKALDQKVRRSNLTGAVKQRYYNFLKKLDKVVKYGWQKGTPKRRKLAEEVRSIPEIIEREWLLEKLGQD